MIVDAYDKSFANSESCPNPSKPTKEQQTRRKKEQTTIHRLTNNLPPQRPSLKGYRGNEHIAVGISLSRHEPITAVVVDLREKKILECQTTKALLKVRGITQSRKGRGIVKLQQAQYRLLGRWRHTRSARRKIKGQPRESDLSESNLGTHLDRLLASRLVRLAQRWHAGTIVLPKLSGIRENVEASIRAKAKRKFPHQKEVQQQYAKQFRSEFHRWSYGRLLDCIAACARQHDLAIRRAKQMNCDATPDSEQDKAFHVVMSACDDLARTI